MSEMARAVTLVATCILAAAACGGDCGAPPTPTSSASPGSPAPTDTNAPITTPGRSPATSGGEVAYVGTDGGLWVMDSGGSDERRVFAADLGSIYQPEWSPDGSRIAFTQIRYLESSQPAEIQLADYTSVVVVDMGGRELLRTPRAAMVHWAPDGTRLSVLREFGLVTEFSLGGVPAIVGMNGGALTDLSTLIETHDAPRWSPDGKWIAYYDTFDGLFVVPGDLNGQPTQLSGGTPLTFFRAMTWVDETSVAVLEKSDAGPSPFPEYVVTDVDGTEKQRISNQNALRCGRMATPGDGQPLAFGSVLIWPIQCDITAGFWAYDFDANTQNFTSYQVRDNSGLVDLAVSSDGRYVLHSPGLHFQPLAQSNSTISPQVTPTPPFIWMVDLETRIAVLMAQGGTQATWRP